MSAELPFGYELQHSGSSRARRIDGSWWSEWTNENDAIRLAHAHYSASKADLPERLATLERQVGALNERVERLENLMLEWMEDDCDRARMLVMARAMIHKSQD